MDAFVELEYRRPEDGQSVTLVAALPTVRALALGGAPTDLRLPGTPAEAVYAQIGFKSGGFHVWPSAAAAPGGAPPASVTRVQLNGDPLADAGHELHDGDVISIDDYHVRYHEGAITPEEQYAGTPCRWRVSLPDLGLKRESDPDDDPSDAHRREFDLSIRPLQQGRNFAEICGRAEAELLRLIRADSADELEPFSRYLWRIRIESALEFKPVEEALELAREATDLYPAATGLLTLLGMVHLRRRDWSAARESFQRALRFAERRKLGFLHEARLGVILAAHAERDAVERSDWNEASDLRDDAGWDVPTIELHSPADDLPFWNLVRQSRIFGEPEKTRFGLVATPGKPAGLGEEQRWVVFDVEKKSGRRHIVRYPAVAYADPSLLVEMAIYRQAAETSRPDWCAGFVELRQSDSAVRPAAGPPVALDRSATERLMLELGSTAAWVRISLSRPVDPSEIWVEVVSQPLPGDLTYEDGGVKVAIAQGSALRLTGTSLSFVEFAQDSAGFAITHPESGQCRAFFRNLVRSSPVKKRAGLPGWASVAIVTGALIVLANVLRLLFAQ